MSSRTRERILAGAAQAVARYGLSKVDMRDVSTAAGLSRPTVYRYFRTRDALLAQLAHVESVRFQQRMLEAVAQASSGPERVLLVLQHATQHIREHPALQRILETDPGVVLQALRREFPTVKAELASVLAAPLADTALVRRRIVTTDQLIDWLVRLMVSAFLLPEPPPGQMAEGLTAVYKLLHAAPRRTASNRSRRRAAPRGVDAPSADVHSGAAVRESVADRSTLATHRPGPGSPRRSPGSGRRPGR